MLITQRVVRVDRSPMNPKKWCLTLECGHERWEASSTKPKRKTSPCDKCKAETNR